MADSLINISPPADPITAIAQAVMQWGKFAEEYAKFLQTAAGQEVAKEQLKDWQAIKNGATSLGASFDKALDGAIKQITKENK